MANGTWSKRGLGFFAALMAAPVLVVALLPLVACVDTRGGITEPTPESPESPESPSGKDAATETAVPEAGPPAAAMSDIPTTPEALNVWLQSRRYQSWAHESAPHPSTGPHGRLVLTFLNPALDASLSAGRSRHPLGAASVKEFFTNGEVSGWAVYVKTEAESNGGRGFYWYEVFDATPGARGTSGQGNPVCTGCHSAGRDFVRIPYPLQ